MMPDVRLIAIPLVALAFAAVLAWTLAPRERRIVWWFRLSLIVTLPLTSILVWAAMPSYMGWPTKDLPKGKVLVLWAEVREPDRKTGDEGAMFIWAVPLEDGEAGLLQALQYPAGPGEPRAYAFPYSRNGHEMLMRARERSAEGRPMVLEMSGSQRLNGPRGQDGEPRDGTDGRGDMRRDDEESEFHMYDLPTASYPPKDE